MPTKHTLKAFTIMELLVSMTLTGILVVFAFMGYNQIQKLFVNYAQQSKFISDYNQLNKALFIMSERAAKIEGQGDKVIAFKTDSNTVLLDLSKKNILLKFASHTDTFDLEAKEPQQEFLKTATELPSTLITHFQCEVQFQTKKFRVSFHKEYDAANVLHTTLELLPPDEQP
jgi:hypothetical protein